MKIKYYSEQFKIRDFPNCDNSWKELIFSKWELIMAAFTVGRANRWEVFSHGPYSFYEMIYRSAMILANLTESKNGYVCKTSAYSSLDPSEKSSVSYFIGIIFTKLLADKVLDIPYLMHLEVYEKKIAKKYGPIVYKRNGKSRPDLIGLQKSLDFVIFESKGRSGAFDPIAYKKAKKQAQRIKSVGTPPKKPKAGIGVQVFFNTKDELLLKWKDPTLDKKGLVYDFLSAKKIVKDYYSPFLSLVNNPSFPSQSEDKQNYLVDLPILDITIGIPKILYEILDEERLTESHLMSIINQLPRPLPSKDELQKSRGNDGILFVFGNNWNNRFKDPNNV